MGEIGEANVVHSRDTDAGARVEVDSTHSHAQESESPISTSVDDRHSTGSEPSTDANGHHSPRANGHVANGDTHSPPKRPALNGNSHGHPNGHLNGHDKLQAVEEGEKGGMLDVGRGNDVEASGKVVDEDDGEPEKKPVSPEQAANPISRLFFWWLNPLMKLGWKKPLEQSDLPPLPTWDDAKNVSTQFAAVWAEEQKKPKPSLTKTLFRAFWYRLTVGAILQLVTVLLQLTPPIFLNSVLIYIQNVPTSNFMYQIFGEHFGYYAAAALLLVPTVRSLVEAQFNNVMFRLGVHVKTALVEIVYDKSLKLSNSARQNKSVGEIVTLMQVDTEKISMTTPFLHTSWSALVQVFLNLGLLIYYIGWSAVTGFLLLLVTIPTQGKLVNLLLKMQRNILLNTGKRVKVVNEVLQGMRVVKCYAWEEPFRKSVSEIREVELGSMKSRVYLRAVQSCLMLATPTLIMVVTFAFYAGVAKGPMDASLVFTALALFNSLRIPLMMYPFVINAILAGHVSIQRVAKYLEGQELKSVEKDEGAGSEPVAVSIQEGNFQWATAKPPAEAAKGGGRGEVPP